MSGEEILTMVWIGLILFGGGGVLWLRVIRPLYQEVVKPFLAGHFGAKTTYVTPAAQAPPRPPYSAQEREPEREPERAERATERVAPPALPPETLDTPAVAPRPTYSQEQMERAQRTARDQGAAEAIGTMIGLGLLPKERESDVLERLYGKRGRRWQPARATIQTVAAQVATPAVERPPIKVRAGTAEEYEVTREVPEKS